MIRRRRRPITVKAVPDGIEFALDEESAEFLLRLPAVLEGLRPGDDDPAARRLHVPVYLDDPDADREWWGFMGDELDQARHADRALFRRTLEAAVDGTVIDAATAHAVVRVLVEVRLVLAARLGIEIESDYDHLEEGDAALLGALGELQMAFLWALGPP